MTSTDSISPTRRTPGDCILFATADWETPYWTNKQHTAAHLAKAGWRVLYVESVGLRAPKMGSGNDWSRIWMRLWRGLCGPRQVNERIWVYSPLVIPFRHNHPWVRAFNQGWLTRTIGRFMRRHHFRLPMLWTYHPFMLESRAWLNRQTDTETGKLVYHCVDDLAAIPGIDGAAFLQEERALLKEADAVFTTSKTLYEKCSTENAKTFDYPNVVDFEHFSSAHDNGPIPPDLETIKHPRLGYIGALSDFKVDFELLLDLARQHPEWNFVLIGQEREGQHDLIFEKMTAMPNVHHLGNKQYQELPAYLRGMDIGLLPTKINSYTKSMFPMKYFEYIASGLRVVSTPLDFTKHQQTGIAIGKDSSSYATAIETQLTVGRLSKMESASAVGHHTWTSRLESMLAQIFPK